MLVSLGLAFLMAGCTHSMKLKVTDTARVPATDPMRIPMRVGLMLDPQFCSYTHEFKNMGDTWAYRFGPHLQKHAISLCEQTFQQVTVSTNGTLPTGVDVVLSPEVHRTGYALSGHTMMFTMLLQWTLRDRDNQQILWMHTADAQAADAPKRVFQALFDHLDARTYQALRESPEIKRLSEGPTPPP